MGYVDPQQNIRSYVDVMNRKTREIGDNFNLKFNQMNQQMRSNIARNAKKMQEAKLKKELGLESYLDLVQSEGEKIKEGWIDMNDDFLRNELGDQYFNLVGLDDVDSIKKRKNIEKIPSTLAKLQGVYRSFREEFDAAIDISGGHAGGYNPATSPRTIGFITDGNNMQYHVNDDGHLELSYEYDGQEFKNVSAQELIAESLTGGVGIMKYGDPFSLRTQIHEDIWKDPDKNFSTAYLTRTQNSPADVNNSETWYLFDDINKQFKDAISNENLYLGGSYKDKPTVLNDANLMRDYWPVIINDAYDEYKKGTGDQYKDLLEKILPESVKGEDAILGTADDKMINIPQPGEGNLIDKNTAEYAEWMGFYQTQGEAGVWDLGNQFHKDLALKWFGSVDPDNKHIKENRKVKETEGANTAANLRNKQLRQKIRSGQATVEEEEALTNDIRTWLRNSASVNAGRKYGNAPNNWATYKGDHTMIIPQMSKWLNSENGLVQFGVLPPKGGEFTIDKRGQVSIIFPGETDDKGDPKVQATTFFFEPGGGAKSFDVQQNYNGILRYVNKQERDDYNTNVNEVTAEDPDGLFQTN